MNAKFINTQNIFRDVHPLMEITQSALENRKESCDLLFSFLPALSAVHVTIAVTLGVSVKVCGKFITS